METDQLTMWDEYRTERKLLPPCWPQYDRHHYCPSERDKRLAQGQTTIREICTCNCHR